jgi:predicted secreted protein
MKRITIFTALIIILVTLLSACAGSSTSEGKTVVVTPAIKENSASLGVGDTLEIQIPTIPKEGFDWVVQDFDTAILQQVGEAVYTADTSPNSAGGVTTLKFNAIAPGNTVVSLLYSNTNSGISPSLSANSFSVVVEVK